MPITPLHMGPALICYPFLRQYFNLIVFGIAQIAMDIEVLVRVVFNIYPIHGFSNNLFGASFILFLLIFIGRPIAQKTAEIWNGKLSNNQKKYLMADEIIKPKAFLFSLAVGIYSHWFFDALMHADAYPLIPFSEAKPFVGLFSIEQINFTFIALIPLGIILSLASNKSSNS